MPAKAGVSVTTVNKILAVAGVVLLLGGLTLGFRSISASGTNCGSVFQPAAGITPMACDSKLNSSSTIVTLVMVSRRPLPGHRPRHQGPPRPRPRLSATRSNHQERSNLQVQEEIACRG